MKTEKFCCLSICSDKATTMHYAILATILISFNILFIEFSVQADKVSFSIDLIHRDSRDSPFYNDSITPSELLTKALQRSQNRVKRLNLPSSAIDEKYIISVMKGSELEFLAKYYIGSQLYKVYALADLTSVLTWIQCEDRVEFYKQNEPPFVPKDSDFYKQIPFLSQACTDFPGKTLEIASNCHYEYDYNEEKYTHGVLSEDTFWFDSVVGERATKTPFESKIFGCGTKNKGIQEHAQGVVGFGRGDLSLVSQLGEDIQYRFAYCLLPVFERTFSKLRFGNTRKNIDDLRTIVSSPLVLDGDHDPSSYYLMLEHISVNKGIEYTPPPLSTLRHHIMIDINTPVTYLNSEIYKILEEEVKKAIPLDPMPLPSTGGTFELCYYVEEGIGVRNFPNMTFHFTRASVHLESSKVFVQDKRKICMTILPSEGEPIFGSIAQENHMVEIDNRQNLVSFAHTDCNLF